MPERLVRLRGRGGGFISVRLVGRAYPEVILARELGRDIDASESPPGFLLGRGPKESRLTPDVLRRGMCLPAVWVLLRAPWEGLVGVVSSLATEALVTEPVARLLDLIVTVEGTLPMPLIEDRGDGRGGVLTRAGSLDRADCTLASKRWT